jgi:hypothetical protein
MNTSSERTRTATCSCGQLKAVATGEPVRVSMCHCLACQRRTGSVFGAQARFAEEKVAVSGTSRTYVRTAESGATLNFQFCPNCGATVVYGNDNLPGFLGIPIGAFADPSFATPAFSVYECSMHSWVIPPAAADRMS